ncbi:MAG: hypothetical protein IKW51_08835 [Bacteroidales bacterium]|nr:hypothetical protein [Bacteroidales bacterium]
MKNIAFISVLLALIAVLTSGRAFILKVSPDEEIIYYITEATEATEATEEIESVEVTEVTIEITDIVEIIESVDETEQTEFIYEEQVVTTTVEEIVEETIYIQEVVESVESVKEPVETQSIQINSLYDDDYNYSNFYGRLYIPSVGIDVALYYELSQSVTDRNDSAAIFTYDSYYGEIIADHSNQDFSKLLNVSVGTIGYIKLCNGDIINIKCVEVINGHNTGTELTDENYDIVMGKYDYLMYTCRNGWTNIRICQWSCY